jgi:multidrug efflux pump subunit AcrA (membrane-fusion protein)
MKSAMPLLGLRLWKACAVFAAICLAQSGAAEDRQKGTGAIVMVAQATQACFSSTIRVTGFLVPRTDAVVTFDMDGFQIAEILVREADRVTAGQPLVRLSRLAGEAATNPGGGQSAGGQNLVLRAPAAGTVIKSAARIGGVASAAEPLFVISVDDQIDVEADVPSIHLGDIKPDQTVRVEMGQGREVSGRVRRIASEIDRATQLARVRVAVDPDPNLRIGGFVRAIIDAQRSCGVSIPRSAVLYRSDGTSVQLVRGRIVEKRPVLVGLLSEREAEIREGVRSGDLIVAFAGTSLREGDEVTPMFIDEATQAGLR